MLKIFHANSVLGFVYGVVGLCGVWAVAGAIVIIWQGVQTTFFVTVEIVLIGWGLACFVIVYGLWKRWSWAPRALITFGIVNFVINAVVIFRLPIPILDIRNAIVLFPFAFMCFVLFYFRRADVRLNFAKRRRV